MVSKRDQKKYFWQFLIFFLGIASCGMANHQLTSSDTPANQVAATCNKLKIWKIAKLEWGKPLELEIAEHYPAPPGSMSAIDSSKIPGPKFYPLRPNLAVNASPNGLAGILKDGEGSQELRLDNVGLTAQDEAFVSIDTKDGQADVCLSNGTSHRVSVKYTDPSWNPSPLVPRMSVVAVEGNRTLTYGYDQAIWYKNGLIDQQFKVNDWTYRHDVFPHLWDMLKFAIPTATLNSSDGTIILSTSGPTGIAIIGLQWQP